MRIRGRVDANHSQIVRDLRKMGATVFSMADLGSGKPDIAVGWRNHNYFFEIKDGNQSPSKRRLTNDEKDFHDNWQGQVDVVETTEEALKILCK